MDNIEDYPKPTGRTSSRWYGIGYHQALADIARILADGDIDAVLDRMRLMTNQDAVRVVVDEYRARETS